MIHFELWLTFSISLSSRGFVSLPLGGERVYLRLLIIFKQNFLTRSFCFFSAQSFFDRLQRVGQGDNIQPEIIFLFGTVYLFALLLHVFLSRVVWLCVCIPIFINSFNKQATTHSISRWKNIEHFLINLKEHH